MATGFGAENKQSGKFYSAYVDNVSIKQMLDGIEKTSKVALLEILREASLLGEKKMKERINTKKSRFGGIRFSYGIGNNEARNDTGNMYRSVISRQSHYTGKVIRNAWGWINNKQPEFWYQDYGFYNRLQLVRFDDKTGKFIFRLLDKVEAKWQEGIFSVRDSRKDVVAELPKIIRKAERKNAQMFNKGKMQ